MTAYEAARVGADGAEWHRMRVIEIPTTADLLVANGKLRAENDMLRAQLAAARRDADRFAGEHALRVQAHDRLDKAARVFVVLGFVFPELRNLLARARKDIWP